MIGFHDKNDIGPFQQVGRNGCGRVFVEPGRSNAPIFLLGKMMLCRQTAFFIATAEKENFVQNAKTSLKRKMFAFQVIRLIIPPASRTRQNFRDLLVLCVESRQSGRHLSQ